MRRIFKSLKSARWPILSSASLGTLIFFPVVAQLFDKQLYEPVATLWGSALGAMAAVAGAFWVADLQASQQRRDAATLVYAMFYPVTSALEELSTVYGPPSRPHRGDTNDEPDILSGEDWRNIYNHAWVVVETYEKFKSKIHRFDAGLNLLSARSMQVALALEELLEDAVRDDVKRLALGHERNLGDMTLFPDGPAHWSTRFAVMTANRDAQDYMGQLWHEAFRGRGPRPRD